MTWRELDVYIEHLPLESATQTARLAAMTDNDFAAAAARERSHGPWSHADLLLAAIADAVERLIFVELRKAGTASAVPPDPIPRPGLRSNVRPINPAAVAYLNSRRAPTGA